mmetsp:Transcript_5802/g.10061  ORF Transcript_5802/g.10061 Transcript_5802/m.10061 type:complete len:651 (+) Transcript_5802:123-2075(+)|eukprot:CAMPEP_0198207528 /NCGR_PEP_ID=MMETSP1445-20131203/10960_1 /TAXON_ID=36898 /ORGANISM="Pyramimonas sp., Strain CCMP2087" /LENGTH=650 /DNA_ID=CAMNT_0043880589 /DNA_START=74 /DNA_END=2026 /DNA_ORIENTATION=-
MSTPEQIVPPRREVRSVSDNYEDSEFRYHDEYEDFGGMSPDIGQHHLERHFASRETQQYPTREYHISGQGELGEHRWQPSTSTSDGFRTRSEIPAAGGVDSRTRRADGRRELHSSRMTRTRTEKLVKLVMRPVKNKFSVELFIHIMLAIAVLVYICLLAEHHLAYMRENQTFIQDFLRHPDGCEKISLFADLKECIKKSVHNFHSLNSDALSPIVVSGMWEFKDVFARLDVKTLKDGGQVLNVSAHTYSLKSSWRHYYISDVDDPFGDSPFAAMSKPLYAIEEVALRFRYKDLNYYNSQQVCLLLDISVHYMILAASGIVKPEITWKQTNCNRPKINHPCSISNFSVLLLASISLLLSMHSFTRAAPNLMARAKKSMARLAGLGSSSDTEDDIAGETYQALQAEPPCPCPPSTPVGGAPPHPLRSLGSYRQRLELHSDLTPIKSWWVICALGNIIQIGSALCILIGGRPTGGTFGMTSLGLGALIAWVNLVRYFEFSGRFYVLVLTLERSMPDILRFLVSSMPILLGFAAMGISIFGSSTKEFSTLQQSVETLFALMNGDSVLQLLNEGDQVPYTGIIFLSTFMLLFVCAVMNVFMTIVMHSYEIIAGYHKHEQGSHEHKHEHAHAHEHEHEHAHDRQGRRRSNSADGCS